MQTQELFSKKLIYRHFSISEKFKQALNIVLCYYFEIGYVSFLMDVPLLYRLVSCYFII